jgi:hypothetical protein
MLARARKQAFEEVQGPTPRRIYAVISLSPWSVLAVLTVLITVAYLLSTLVQVAVFVGEYPIPNHIVRLVDLDQENNLPTWLSSTNLLICTILAAAITKAKQAQRDNYTRYWFGLCLAFLYLSVDEAASIHELPTNRLRDLVGASGAFFAAWVIPAMIAVSIFALLYLRFLLSLPRRIQALIVLAGVLYVLGGVGFEMVSWHYRSPMFDPEDHLASRDLTYMMINHFEEFLEMLGVALFIYALLSYIDIERISISMIVSQRRRDSIARAPTTTSPSLSD